MDRIFETNTISHLCTELTSALRESKECMEQMKQAAQKAESAANAVPAEARSEAVSSAANALRSKLSGIDLEQVITKLEDCKTRACTLIPAADSQYASQTDQLVSTANQLKSAISQMREFLVSNPFSADYQSFLVAFEAAQAAWQKVEKDAEAALDTVLKNVKGAETVSQVFSKDPVNLSTGNFIYDRTDLEIGGVRPFLFRRFYNAINDWEGSLGKDWNHNFEVCVRGTKEERVLHLEEGKEERFFRTSTGIYASMGHSNGTFTETTDGYTYENRDGLSYYFSPEGLLTYQEDRNGNRITLSYEEVQGNPRLTKAETDTGLWYALTYQEDGTLACVRDHTGRTVRYAVERGLLKEVITPAGTSYRYGYSADGKVESVLNPRDIVTVENEYDQQMRIIKQTFPDGSSMSYRYDDENHTVELTERNGSKVTYVHDEKYRDIKHIHSDGEERYEYNQLNQKTLVVDKLGNKTQYGYDSKGNLTRVINALGTKIELQYEKNNQPTYIAVDGKEKVRNRYDEKGNLIERRDALGNVYELGYEEHGHPTKITQPDGNCLGLTYDSRGNITELTDASGSVTRFSYDALNRVTGTTDGNGNRTAYEYNALDLITKVTNANGDSRTYEYNKSGKVTRIIDFDGSTIRREYNVLNKPSKVIDQQGRETLLTYDAMWNLARVAEPNGAKTTFLYDEHNRLGRIKNANGDVVRYTYDANGNRIGIQDENGVKTTFTYDALGRLIKAEGAEGSSMCYIYDREGNLTGATDALGNEVTMEYDAIGQLQKEVNPLGESRSYTYDALGNVKTITDESGRTTRYVYEKGGRLQAIHHPDMTKESYTYDAAGNVRSYSDTAGFTLTYTYDSLGRMMTISGSGGEVKSYTYDAVGNVRTMTDALGNCTQYEYSLTGQLTRVMDALGNETEYQYDVCDRLIEIRQYGEIKGSMDEALLDATQKNEQSRSVQVTRYTRDITGQVKTVMDALGNTEQYRYDKKGQLLEKLDKEGYLTKYGYTGHGDVSYIQYADGKEVKLSYNSLRHLTEIEDWLGLTRIRTDAMGRATQITYPDGKEVSYTYGASGERTSMTYPDGRILSYRYDEQMRLSELKEGEVLICYGYDKIGRLESKSYPNGMKSHYTYDQKGQLKELLHQDREGLLDRYSYQYDLLGNKTEITKERRGLPEESGRYTYGYDPLGRLTHVSRDDQFVRGYHYDAYGNRIGREEENQQTRYQYNALNQLLSEQRTGAETLERSYQYDKRGNLSQVLENGNLKSQYLYGALNRLEYAVNGNGEAATYSYNGLGFRVGKQTGGQTPDIWNSHSVEQSLDPLNKLRNKEFNSEKKIAYTIDLTREYHNLLEKSEENYCQTYLWDGNVAAYSEGEQYTYYMQDDLGSPIRLHNETGRHVESYGYGEFGEDLYGNQGLNQVFGYTGYQKDRIAGTYFAQAREYRPEAGQFGGQDVVCGYVMVPLSVNRYIYCMDNPKSYVDNNGKWITVAIGAVVGGLVGGIGSAVSQMLSGKKISEVNWKDVGIDALSGAATGAIAGTGAGLGILAAGGAGVGAVNYATKTTVNNEWGKKSVQEHVIEGSLSVAEWSLATVAGGNISPAKLNGLQGELKFSTQMLKESARGISTQQFYKAVKKDIVKEIGKTAWKTFYKSMVRTGIVGIMDSLYNIFGKEKLIELIENVELNCPQNS